MLSMVPMMFCGRTVGSGSTRGVYYLSYDVFKIILKDSKFKLSAMLVKFVIQGKVVTYFYSCVQLSVVIVSKHTNILMQFVSMIIVKIYPSMQVQYFLNTPISNPSKKYKVFMTHKTYEPSQYVN